MVDCDKLKTNFSDYLDGDIPLEQRKQLDDHFEHCPDCHEIIRQMKIIQDSLKKLPQVNTSPDFEKRLHQQIFNPAPKNNFVPPILSSWKLPAMGSAIVLATVGLFLVLDNSSDSGTSDYQELRNNFNTAAPQIPAGNQKNAAIQEDAVAEENVIIPQKPRIEDSLRVNQEGVQEVGNRR